MYSKIIILLALAGTVLSNDMVVGLKDNGKKIFDEKFEASPAIWRQVQNVTINTTDDEVISKVVVTDLRPDKDGDVKIVDGGEGQKRVTLELKSPTVLRGYDFHVEVFATSDKNQEQLHKQLNQEDLFEHPSQTRTERNIAVTTEGKYSMHESTLNSFYNITETTTDQASNQQDRFAHPTQAITERNTPITLTDNYSMNESLTNLDNTTIQKESTTTDNFKSFLNLTSTDITTEIPTTERIKIDSASKLNNEKPVYSFTLKNGFSEENSVPEITANKQNPLLGSPAPSVNTNTDFTTTFLSNQQKTTVQPILYEQNLNRNYEHSRHIRSILNQSNTTEHGKDHFIEHTNNPKTFDIHPYDFSQHSAHKATIDPPKNVEDSKIKHAVNDEEPTPQIITNSDEIKIGYPESGNVKSINSRPSILVNNVPRNVRAFQSDESVSDTIASLHDDNISKVKTDSTDYDSDENPKYVSSNLPDADKHNPLSRSQHEEESTTLPWLRDIQMPDHIHEILKPNQGPQDLESKLTPSNTPQSSYINTPNSNVPNASEHTQTKKF